MNMIFNFLKQKIKRKPKFGKEENILSYNFKSLFSFSISLKALIIAINTLYSY